ncbi:MAG TPA: L-threonylcarbamoyladenylate synthase [Candidatus Saccharimonadales bacterium]|nr:L-threonylcarbamoyladenylate synthase [Candidatus Saccharimonadales bacterium]
MRQFTKFNQEVINLIKAGKIGVIPTDTVYGMVCRATDQSAVKRLYALKLRDHKPGTVIAANIDQLVELGIKYRYLKAVEQLWPGAISIIIPSSEELNYLHLGARSLAIRIPDDKSLEGLLKEVEPLLTTSANKPSEPIANTIVEAQKYFGERVDFYVDGGNLTDHPPSTIIRVVDDAIEVIREGAVKIDENGRIT